MREVVGLKFECDERLIQVLQELLVIAKKAFIPLLKQVQAALNTGGQQGLKALGKSFEDWECAIVGKGANQMPEFRDCFLKSRETWALVLSPQVEVVPEVVKQVSGGNAESLKIIRVATAQFTVGDMVECVASSVVNKVSELADEFSKFWEDSPSQTLVMGPATSVDDPISKRSIETGNERHDCESSQGPEAGALLLELGDNYKRHRKDELC